MTDAGQQPDWQAQRAAEQQAAEQHSAAKQAAEQQAAWQAYYAQQAWAANQAGAGQPAYGYPAQPAWTPPPKPGLLPLRPLGFGALLAAPFRALRRNTGPQFGSAVLVQLVTVLAVVPILAFVYVPLLSRVANGETRYALEFVSGAVGWSLVFLMFTVIAGVILATFLQAVLVIDIASGTLGEKWRIGALWRRAARSFWPVLGASLLMGLAFLIGGGIIIGIFVAVMLIATTGAGSNSGTDVGVAGAGIAVIFLGFLLLLVGYGWLGTRLAVVSSAIVLERIGPVQAIRRSWQLTRGYFWRTFGVIVLVAVIMSCASQVVSTPVSLIFTIAASTFDPTNAGSFTGAMIVGLILIALVGLITGAVTQAVQTSLNAVIYIDLRMRKEALDLTLERHVIDREAGLPTTDPYLPVRS
ncbi:MAG TPA: glycerophosphoryl diester phosphodiesterase membrane domain-containing protein [Candidatus Lumbricidophila sp.]|nr:glycerophosphoryl diester phosphodiesterase membrane domain-containing protein [Candidatus Lumbricidophila sp.]